MVDFILRDGNLPFTVAVGLMVGLAGLEVVTLLLGFALSGLVDHWMPDVDIDANLDGVPDHPTLSAIAHWLHVGDAPALALFVVFLTSFGIGGWGVQYAARESLGHFLSPWLASVPALAIGVVSMRGIGGLLAKLGFKDETTAVSSDSLVGATAQITLGATRRGHPSQAKLKDKHGQTHYVLVEPMREEDEFQAGSSVILIRREGAKFYVVEDSIDAVLRLGPEDLPAELRQKA
jgi:hypothetical protein